MQIINTGNRADIYKKNRGFSLIELMMVLVIVGILTGIAYPSYTSYVLRGKRAEGKAFLMDAAAKQERFYSDCNRYGTLTGTRSCATGIANIGTSSETDLYTLTVGGLGANNQTFTLTADPAFDDPECENLTLNQAGTRSKTGGTGSVEDCWGR